LESHRCRTLAAALLTFAALFPLSAAAQKVVLVHEVAGAEAASQDPVPPISLARVADLIHELVNEVRAHHRLPAVRRDPSLDQISYRHSRDMGSNGYFDHVDLKGRNATRRARAQRYVCLTSMENPKPVSIGENLFAGFLYSEYTLTYYPGHVAADYTWMSEDEFARGAVEAWMGSPSHRANLLHPDYHSEGIGVYLTASLEIYVTQNLC
jgi:uncharacterized protein YkwD